MCILRVQRKQVMRHLQWRRNPEDVGPKDLSVVKNALAGCEGFAVIGAAAVTQFAPGRFTHDVDILCLPESYLPIVYRLRESLSERGQPMRFGKRWELFRVGTRFRQMPVDVLRLRDEIADELFPRGIPTVLSQGVPILRKPELCLLKMIAGRARDDADVHRLVRTMVDSEIRRAHRLIRRVLGEEAARAFDNTVSQERAAPF